MRVHVRHQQREVHTSTLFSILLLWNALFSVAVFIPAIWINFIQKAQHKTNPLSEIEGIWYGSVLLLWSICEIPRLYLGITGNRDHQIAPVLMFAVLTIVIHFVIMIVFNVTPPQKNALDTGLTSVQMIFAIGEFIVGIPMMPKMIHQNTVDFYSHLWQEGSPHASTATGLFDYQDMDNDDDPNRSVASSYGDYENGEFGRDRMFGKKLRDVESSDDDEDDLDSDDSDFDSNKIKKKKGSVDASEKEFRKTAQAAALRRHASMVAASGGGESDAEHMKKGRRSSFSASGTASTRPRHLTMSTAIPAKGKPIHFVPAASRGSEAREFALDAPQPIFTVVPQQQQQTPSQNDLQQQQQQEAPQTPPRSQHPSAVNTPNIIRSPGESNRIRGTSTVGVSTRHNLRQENLIQQDQQQQQQFGNTSAVDGELSQADEFNQNELRQQQQLQNSSEFGLGGAEGGGEKKKSRKKSKKPK